MQVQYDSTNDLLYVANGGNNSVAVFANAGTVVGNVAPTRSLAGGTSQITSISSIWLDTTDDELWLADPTANAILVFGSASTLNGGPAPSRVLSGAATQLNSPSYLFLTSTEMFVSSTPRPFSASRTRLPFPAIPRPPPPSRVP